MVANSLAFRDEKYRIVLAQPLAKLVGELLGQLAAQTACAAIDLASPLGEACHRDSQASGPPLALHYRSAVAITFDSIV